MCSVACAPPLVGLLPPGRIRNIGGSNFIKFGELDNRRSDHAAQLQEAFRKTGVTVDIPPEIHKALWENFLTITSFGGVGAVSRAPIGAIRARPETRRLVERCMNEVFDVAASRQVALPASIVADTMAVLDTVAADGTASMLRDIRDGKPSELEY